MESEIILTIDLEFTLCGAPIHNHLHLAAFLKSTKMDVYSKSQNTRTINFRKGIPTYKTHSHYNLLLHPGHQ